MKFTQICNRLALLGLVGVSCVSGEQQSSSTTTALETVSMCELTRDWKKFDHRVIRTAGIYRAGFEASEIYDPSCPIRDNTAWVPFDTEKAVPPELKERLNELLQTDGRARITVVGEFDGPKKVDIPPDTPPKLAHTVRYVNSRYGHQIQWRFQFVFSQIEKVESVPASEPWPQWARKEKK